MYYYIHILFCTFAFKKYKVGTQLSEYVNAYYLWHKDTAWKMQFCKTLKLLWYVNLNFLRISRKISSKYVQPAQIEFLYQI